MNFNNLVAQAQQMQRKVNKLKKQFNEKEFDIISQNELITGKMKGNLSITELHIDQSLLNIDSKEDIEDLIMITINQTVQKIEKEREDTLNKATNGVDVSAFL
ncbi:YbaB/EbfC family nucleoid-associated protein [Candidatus Stoquefichus massiliensis]|uniref:YbaB/EbfC family nucleoid-associated protein n=1 Tax=Candidatus Stoquefichus massiliensis TaxID=1470350 RepID=UPI00048019D6|nr:YbaB/EbfC family nucleoid-associated protein [Candidatus Stoquefichus massiliensis]